MRTLVLLALASLAILAAPSASAAVHEVRTAATGDDAAPHAFEPRRLVVAIGDTVRWGNGDGVYHTVKSSSKLDANEPSDDFGGVLSGGATVEHTFTDAGEWRYFCQPHAGFMHGFVTVQDTSASVPDTERGAPGPGLALILGAAALAGAARRVR